VPKLVLPLTGGIGMAPLWWTAGFAGLLAVLVGLWGAGPARRRVAVQLAAAA
jgi:hypothetical protein